MADRRSLKWKTLLVFVTVVLSCESIKATNKADREEISLSTDLSSLRKRTDTGNQYEASRPKRLLHKLDRARQQWWWYPFQSHEHQGKKNGLNKQGSDPKTHRELPRKGNTRHIRWHGLGNRIVRPRVQYGTTLYRKTLQDDDDQPRIVLPPDDSPKTPETKHIPGGTRSVAHRALPPTPIIPTAPPLPVTEEVTSQPTVMLATTHAQSTAKPPTRPTKATSKPAIINIIPSPNQIPRPSGPVTNTTNIQLNLEIGDNNPSETNEGIPTTPNPPHILVITQAPSPPPPQIIMAPPPPTAPPPPPPLQQTIIIREAPTPPSVPQPLIINAASPPKEQPVIIHEAPSPPSVPRELIINAASDPHPEPIVIASPPSPQSVILSSDERPSQHSVVVVAPPSPSVMVASQPASPGGTIALMGFPPVQSPMSSLLMGQVPLPQMSPMGYPVGMQLTPQSPFTFLQSPLMPSPLSRFMPPFPSSVGLGSSMYDPQLLMSLTSLFSGALQTTLTQSQPNVLTSALVQAAIQAQTQNQPPDVLTAALTQALAQRMSPNNGQTDTNRLIQALTTALSQVQSQRPLSQPQAPSQAPSPAIAPLPAAFPPAAPLPAQQTYQVLPVQTVASPSMDSTSADSQSLGNVGKALANALVRAARNLARQKRIYHRDRDVHRSRPFYRRPYASVMPRSFYYPHSYDHFESMERSPITRRNKIERWYKLKRSPISYQPSCGCCFCC